MDMELLKTGVYVMLIGMGTVFVFLFIMIGMMYINSAVLKFINKYCPEEIETPKNNKKKKEVDMSEIAAAIACALMERSKNA